MQHATTLGAKFFLLCLSASILISASCGYKVKSSVRSLPSGINSLGIPTFRNLTTNYKVEHQITRAVLKEFSSRTRMPIYSRSSNVDALLLGEILTINSTPVTFGTDTFGSAFIVSLNLAVKLVRTTDGSIIWENRDYFFQERYVINTKVIDFFSEESPALDRLARDFASGLASSVLNR